LIQQTRENIVYWNQNFNNSTERLAQLQMLQDQLAAQRQQLDLMLQQRTLISASALSATQAIQLQKQEALAGVAADQQDARDEVESLRDSIIRLQQSQRTIRSTQVSLGSQLSRAQSALQTQETQVKNLETAVQQKRQELEGFVQ
jgi:chromosome segregation ATPase